jgi:hypothetical protein
MLVPLLYSIPAIILVVAGICAFAVIPLLLESFCCVVAGCVLCVADINTVFAYLPLLLLLVTLLLLVSLL